MICPDVTLHVKYPYVVAFSWIQKHGNYLDFAIILVLGHFLSFAIILVLANYLSFAIILALATIWVSPLYGESLIEPSTVQECLWAIVQMCL